MKFHKRVGIPLLVVLLTCGVTALHAKTVAAGEYVLMQEDLAELRSAFNQAVDQVRLVFIVGPT